MMVQFLMPHVVHLSKRGFDIDLACSEVGARLQEVREALSPYVGRIYKLSLKRTPLSFKNAKGYGELKEILAENHYDFIWTNEPVMSVMTRLAAKKARKNGTKVVYMAHGFHFYKGAPLLNWALFYPIEKIMAQHADMISTVNLEDFSRAGRFNVNEVRYIHGIGINTARLSTDGVSKNLRRELNLPEGTFVILSIGELNRNKNQKTIIKALSALENENIHYVLCGKGAEEQNLKGFAKECGLERNVHFLGYRKDVVDICTQADVYVMPSHREGLPVSSLEAMYCGLPLVTSDIRGLTDVNKAGINGFLCAPDDFKAYADAIKNLYEHPGLRTQMGAKNKQDVMPFTIEKTLFEVENLFKF